MKCSHGVSMNKHCAKCEAMTPSPVGAIGALIDILDHRGREEVEGELSFRIRESEWRLLREFLLEKSTVS